MLRLRGQQNRQYSARATGATSPNVFGPHFQLHVQNRCTLEQLSLCTCNTCHMIRSCNFHSARANLEHCTCERWLHVQRWTCWFVARAKQCAVIVARANGSLVDLLHVQLNIVARAIACPLHVQKLCAPAKTRGLQEMTQFPICTCLFTDKANS